MEKTTSSAGMHAPDTGSFRPAGTNGKKRILVVDDDPDVLEQVSLMLRGENYEIHRAGSLTSAEEVLLSMRPDLAVVDLMMEHQDSGFVLCHRIANLYPGVPVIMLSAVRAATGLSFAANGDEQASWIKAQLFLDKPVRGERLRYEIQRLLGASPEASA